MLFARAYTEVKIDGQSLKFFSPEELDPTSSQFEIRVYLSVSEAMWSDDADGDGEEDYICQCFQAAILNHEMFLWVNMYGNHILEWKNGKLTNEQLLKKLKQDPGIRYGNIFTSSSSLRRAHHQLLKGIAQMAISDPKTDKDYEHNQKIVEYLEDVKRALVEEMVNTSKKYNTESKRADFISKERKRINKLINSVKVRKQ